jgi:hypothetical protein
MVDWDGDNMRLHDNWVWDLDWDMDWERHFDFLDDWNFDLLVDWEFLNVMMVNGVHVVWDGDLDMLATRGKKNESVKRKVDAIDGEL